MAGKKNKRYVQIIKVFLLLFIVIPYLFAQVMVAQRREYLEDTPPQLEDAKYCKNFRKALNYDNDKNWKEAVKKYQKALEEKPNAIILSEKAKNESIKSYIFNRFLQATPEEIKTYQNIMNPVAEAIYQKAIRNNDIRLLERLIDQYYFTSIRDKGLAYLTSIYLESGKLDSISSIVSKYENYKYITPELGLKKLLALSLSGNETEFTKYKKKIIELYKDKTKYPGIVKKASKIKYSKLNNTNSDWLTMGGNNQLSKRFKNTVSPEERKWVFPKNRIYPKGNGIYPYPAIKGNNVYVQDSKRIYSLDLSSGKLLWAYPELKNLNNIELASATENRDTNLTITTGCAINRNNLYSNIITEGSNTGLKYSDIICLNAESGIIKWQAKKINPNEEWKDNMFAFPPIYEAGYIIALGESKISSNKYNLTLYSFDAETGDLLWKNYIGLFSIDMKKNINLAIYKNVICLLTRSGCVFGLDIFTGKILWYVKRGNFNPYYKASDIAPFKREMISNKFLYVLNNNELFKINPISGDSVNIYDLKRVIPESENIVFWEINNGKHVFLFDNGRLIITDEKALLFKILNSAIKEKDKEYLKKHYMDIQIVEEIKDDCVSLVTENIIYIPTIRGIVRYDFTGKRLDLNPLSWINDDKINFIISTPNVFLLSGPSSISAYVSSKNYTNTRLSSKQQINKIINKAEELFLMKRYTKSIEILGSLAKKIESIIKENTSFITPYEKKYYFNRINNSISKNYKMLAGEQTPYDNKYRIMKAISYYKKALSYTEYNNEKIKIKLLIAGLLSLNEDNMQQAIDTYYETLNESIKYNVKTISGFNEYNYLNIKSYILSKLAEEKKYYKGYYAKYEKRANIEYEKLKKSTTDNAKIYKALSDSYPLTEAFSKSQRKYYKELVKNGDVLKANKILHRFSDNILPTEEYIKALIELSKSDKLLISHRKSLLNEAQAYLTMIEDSSVITNEVTKNLKKDITEILKIVNKKKKFIFEKAPTQIKILKEENTPYQLVDINGYDNDDIFLLKGNNIVKLNEQLTPEWINNKIIPSLGIKGKIIDLNAPYKGFKITKINDIADSSLNNLLVGDTIININGKTFNSIAQLKQLYLSLPHDKKIKISLKRNNYDMVVFVQPLSIPLSNLDKAAPIKLFNTINNNLITVYGNILFAHKGHTKQIEWQYAVNIGKEEIKDAAITRDYLAIYVQQKESRPKLIIFDINSGKIIVNKTTSAQLYKSFKYSNLYSNNKGNDKKQLELSTMPDLNMLLIKYDQGSNKKLEFWKLPSGTRYQSSLPCTITSQNIYNNNTIFYIYNETINAFNFLKEENAFPVNYNSINTENIINNNTYLVTIGKNSPLRIANLKTKEWLNYVDIVLKQYGNYSAVIINSTIYVIAQKNNQNEKILINVFAIDATNKKQVLKATYNSKKYNKIKLTPVGNGIIFNTTNSMIRCKIDDNNIITNWEIKLDDNIIDDTMYYKNNGIVAIETRNGVMFYKFNKE